MEYKNFAKGTLDGSLASDGTTLEITTTETFPSSDNFKVVIWDASSNQPQDDSTREIMTLEWNSGNSNYDIISRGEESTSAKAWDSGDNIAHVVTAEQFTGYEGKGNVSNANSPVDNDFAKFTDATTIEGRSYAEVRTDLNVEDGADVTANAGALMDSEVTNLAQVKAFDSSNYATSAQGSTADSALQDIVDDTSPQLGGDLDLQTNKIVGEGGSEGVYVDSDGNVGIDTTGPNERLDVSGTNPRIYLGDATAPGTTTNRLYSVSGALYWNGTDLTAGGGGGGKFVDGDDSNDAVYTGGNVGIGTTSPSAELEVAGDFLTTGTYSGIPSVPATGEGTRMFFDPESAAFRAGYVDSTQWDNANIGNYSVAMGYETTASGSYSTAMGRWSTASGNSSTSMGSGNAATGDYSTTMGSGTTATGDYSAAWGNGADAKGDYSIAMGRITEASGYCSFVMGRDSEASANYGFSMGYDTTASGNYSVAMGGYNTASGTGSVAMGRGNSASDKYTVALGYSTSASNDYCFAVGQDTSASGNTSTAIGHHTSSSGTGSTSMGYYTNASQAYSTAMGRDTTASGVGSTAMGAEIEAAGEYSVAIALSDQNGAILSQNNTMAIMGGNVGIGTTAPSTALHNVGAYTQEPLSSDPTDPDAGNSVQWVSDGTVAGQNAGDVMMKINVGGTVKMVKIIDFNAL